MPDGVDRKVGMRLADAAGAGPGVDRDGWTVLDMCMAIT
jgi:hypothetical protein